MSERIGVIGAGSWGTTLANLLAKKGADVTLWAYEPELVAEMRERRVNSLFLPGIELSAGLAFTNSLEEAAAGKDIILLVSPSQVMRTVLRQLAPLLRPGVTLVNASKGIELDTMMTVDQVCAEVLPAAIARRFCVLSGPSFAREVAQEMPTAVVAAATDQTVAALVQRVFATPYFRVYTNGDVMGVEIGGSLKNVIAVAAGISDGLGLGHNTRAALITRGLAEMTRLGVAMGADPATFAGLAGMGDLVLTCTGDLSRNRTVGMKLGQGMRLAEILGEMRMVAEGVKTAESAWRLAARIGVEMPITEKVYQVLYEDKPARQAVLELMTRDPKAERG
ncbi:NAD(P)H-dependent glycerol-3-phosphate dehydrogenase [Geobacter pickeringii]|uniref:Glycerol-3-phosphate dehydrogenase [NAD(P)+] n=1 Tax=Geobacter pickeringii TaxID=345632 RepID=A0A0B5BD01_9BACT|nr:NAD(P)H-dependent glycerol-3-phosphate dehydrogenase [Geobacter pickeringii]AJE01976.1 glycerol-3-phosphate dehydrogenase [Geobacter pickeringii]